MVFTYPAGQHARRRAPRGYTDYGSYKDWLRDEFCFRCVYCLCRERWCSDGHEGFSVDHVTPQAADPDRVTDYSNLVYACTRCNSRKAAVHGLADPCTTDFRELLRVREDGTVEALNQDGERLSRVVRLNEPTLVDFRRELMRILEVLARAGNATALGLVNHYMGFPADLPNLAVLRPPNGNDLPHGIDDSGYSRRVRGELPQTY